MMHLWGLFALFAVVAANNKQQDYGDDVIEVRNALHREQDGGVNDGYSDDLAAQKTDENVIPNVTPQIFGRDSHPQQTYDDGRARLFFFATSSTTTKFKLAFVTSTTPYTCVKTASDAKCAGRRRRSSLLMRNAIPNIKTMLNDVVINGSIDDVESGDDEVSSEREPRNFLTVWTTSFSTRTVTSYVTDRGVTVSVSAYCTGSGVPGCAV
ncbi:uncharacterized protein LOC108667345 [Hyalella azteca]|uniref:Uncharacterized protein LOC108667345 n=1 Tax=Hyalella azteca TaxID=294128 RepID=A0A8B7N7N1_HYAAZ|nr:uncharacterized protein LOC108667345 [Hyalella azteca]